MHAGRLAGRHVSTSELVMQGWRVVFIDYGVGMLALQTYRLVRHGFVFVGGGGEYACRR